MAFVWIAAGFFVGFWSALILTSNKEQIMAGFDELNAKLDGIATVVSNVAADVADLIRLLNEAGNVPQEILDKADAIKASLDGIDAEH